MEVSLVAVGRPGAGPYGSAVGDDAVWVTLAHHDEVARVGAEATSPPSTSAPAHGPR